MLSKRTNNLNSSFIRDILAVTQQPGIISFAGGLPDPKLFPMAALQAAANVIHKERGADLYQYGESSGNRELREWIATHFHKEKIDAESIIITTGSQQGLDMTSRCLLNPGDRVAIEAPSYLGAIQIFRASEARLCPIASDEEGPDPVALEREFSEEKTRVFYAVPEFHNPTGASYSLERRMTLVALAKKYGVWIIEDAPYTPLRYKGETLPSLQSLLPDQVIHLGSFSKMVAPGLRLGWLSGADSIIEAATRMKQVTDLHSSCYDQHLMLEFLRSGALPGHLDMLKQHYGRRLEIMSETLDRQLGHKIHRSNPEGGMFIWLEIQGEINALSLFNRAVDKGVAFVPGEAFYTNGDGKNCMRLNFTNSEPEQIVEGVTRLASLLQ